MDKTTAMIVVLGILALVFIAFFAVFRKSGKGKIKGPFGTGLEVEGSNEPQQTQIKEVEAGGNIHISEAGGHGVEAYKLKAGGDVVIGSLATTAVKANDGTEKVVHQVSPKVHKLTLKEIRDRIESTPPFQQDDVKRHYAGLTVDWQARLLSVSKRDEETLTVLLIVDDNGERHVGACACDVSIAKYPELKILNKDHQMRVIGKIAKIEPGEIFSIAEATLFF